MEKISTFPPCPFALAEGSECGLRCHGAIAHACNFAFGKRDGILPRAFVQPVYKGFRGLEKRARDAPSIGRIKGLHLDGVDARGVIKVSRHHPLEVPEEPFLAVGLEQIGELPKNIAAGHWCGVPAGALGSTAYGWR